MLWDSPKETVLAKNSDHIKEGRRGQAAYSHQKIQTSSFKCVFKKQAAMKLFAISTLSLVLTGIVTASPVIFKRAISDVPAGVQCGKFLFTF